MRRAGFLLGVFVLMGAIAVPAAANQPAFRFIEDVTGDTIECEDESYTITSGEIQIVIHEGQAAQGNENFTGTITPRKVVAEDSDGNQYRVVGAFWFGATFNVNADVFQATFTGKLQIISKGGGTADNVNMTFHITAHPNNFVLNEFDFGTCEEPEG